MLNADLNAPLNTELNAELTMDLAKCTLVPGASVAAVTHCDGHVCFHCDLEAQSMLHCWICISCRQGQDTLVVLCPGQAVD
jgi:hypothetical protein